MKRKKTEKTYLGFLRFLDRAKAEYPESEKLLAKGLIENEDSRKIFLKYNSIRKPIYMAIKIYLQRR